MGDKERNIQKLSSISPKLSQGCSQQEPWARVWIFSPLSIHSFYLNTVLCGFMFLFSEEPYFLLIWNGSFFSRLQRSLREQAAREMGQLQHRICRLEAGGIAARARTGRVGIRKCVRGFLELPGARDLPPDTCLHVSHKLWFWKTIASCMTIYRKPNICTTPPFPPISYETFFIL